MRTNSLPHLRRVCLALVALAVACASMAPAARAFNLNNSQWFQGPVNLILALGPADRTLQDGNTSWDAVATQATSDWNSHLGILQFAVTVDDNATPARGDKQNTVAFSDTIYGDVFGDETVAVTLLSFDSATGFIDEGDVLVNRAFTFDSYSGPLQDSDSSQTIDLHRVLLHEFGHVLGLLHPDAIGQSVSAVMNSVLSDTDHLTTDDLAGITAIYGDPALKCFDLPVNSLTVESGRGLIYSTTVKANGKGRLKAFDPFLGEVTAKAHTGLKPGVLTESDGGEHLYLGIDSLGVIDQIDPDSLAVTREFPIGAQAGVTAGDISTLPSAPESVLVSQKGNAAGAALHGSTTASADFAIYDSGVMRPEEEFDSSTTPGTPVNVDEKGGTFYAFLRTFYDLGDGKISRLTLEAGGVSPQVQTGVFLTANLTGGAWYQKGLLYGSDGTVSDLVQGVRDAPFSDIFRDGGEAFTVTVDADLNEAYFTVPAPGFDADIHKPTLLVDKLSTRSELGSIGLPRYTAVYQVERWGANGLLFVVDGGRMFLIRSNLLKPGPVSGLPTVVTLGTPNHASIDEGGTQKSKLVIERTNDDLSAPLTVQYFITGTAQNGADYRVLSGSVTIPAGQATAKIKVRPTGSQFSGGPRTVQIRLSPENAYRWGASIAGTVTLTSN